MPYTHLALAMTPTTEPSSQAGSSSPPEPAPSSGDDSADTIATCKRRISELEAEIEQIRNTNKKNKS